MSFPVGMDFSFSLNRTTRLVLRVQVHRLLRQPSPYPSHCVRLWNETRLGSVMTQSSLGGRAYGQTCCSRLCRLNWIADRCDCIWHQVRQGKKGGMYCIVLIGTVDLRFI